MRKIVFWCHLSLGVAAGVFILIMSATGVLLAFEDPMVAWAESDAPRPASEGPRLSLTALAAKAGEGLDAITVSADAGKPVVLGFGRGKTKAIDPRTGEFLASGSRTRDFFKAVEGVHRWLGVRELGKPVTGAANAAFLLLVLGGPILWWPRARKAAIVVPDLGLRGKTRDFNWHNAAGIWAAPVLLAITASGLLMSYEGATALLYNAFGDAEPVAIPASEVKPAPGLDSAFLTAAGLVPEWETIMLRLPAKPGAELRVNIVEPSVYPPAPRSQLRLDPATGEILKWEPASAALRGRRLRAFARFLHTGEALGFIGRLAAALASAAGVLLVWTGLALAWRRWRKK